MAPHASTPTNPSATTSSNPPRILIIGAGSRGSQYSRCVAESTPGIVYAVAEPIPYKRQRLGSRYIWGSNAPSPGQSFSNWKEFLDYELDRRARASRGESVPPGVNAAFICVLDEMHKEVIVGLKPLGLHIMCEKPLATTLADCVEIYRAMLPDYPRNRLPEKIFSIGHVLRYSPHNMMLRKLLLEERVIGDVLSINHTEPVGWWHFTHSYVRGNWRRESTTAPSLLTKSCHDIDLLLWLLCSPSPSDPTAPPHLPETITSTGSLQQFTRTRKPKAAGTATNCLSCPIEPDCKYSAKDIYISPKFKGLKAPNTNWPVDILVPDIEDILTTSGSSAAESAVLSILSKDYTAETPISEIEAKNWFGRCVYESDNTVNDDQFVTMTFPVNPSLNRGAKQASFHMVSHTKKICERYTHIYGSDGEIYADSTTIEVEDFKTGEKKVYEPKITDTKSGHGGGDEGLVRQFVGAVNSVMNEGADVEVAQREWVGCSLEEVIRSHAVVFAAEEARKDKLVLNFENWWDREVVGKLNTSVLVV
ncbi:9b138fc4-e0fc-47ff-94df-6ad01298725f [Sclerotinia trifoliorum]|uniref:9b138fc4-e0fc-47ff-94df-6ad01298725f n=1 Tax=Sclerotinia trifoliorum TaxID=28548 RepID=A0A8H2VXV7_9HELO|nr:9b138fc4-e0fc-47ff-94df-6ad01298725f [Sclerotinia trifoliorum]